MESTVLSRAPVRGIRARRDYERRLLLSAIQLIASGGAPRVTLVGLQSAERLLGQARSLQSETGVQISGSWTDGSCELTVERVR
jgi:hypothetical protein